MNAGRTLDELVHTHVMGQRVDDGRSWSIPRYSTEISEAWQVVEWLDAHEDVTHVVTIQSSVNGDGTFEVRVGCYCEDPPLDDEVIEYGPAPLAICLAALRAVGVEV